MSSSSTMFLLCSLVTMLLPLSITAFDITNFMTQYPAYRSYRNYITRKLQYTALPPISVVLPIPVPVPVVSPVPVISPVPVVSPVPVPVPVDSPVPVPAPIPFPVPVNSPVPVVSPVPVTTTTPSPAAVAGPAGVPGPALSPMSPDGAPADNKGEGPKSGVMKSDVNNALALFLTFTTIYVLMSRSMHIHD